MNRDNGKNDRTSGRRAEGMIEELIKEMTAYYHGDPKRIQHFMKVHDFSRTMGKLENLDKDTLFVLETAAVVHDIGIRLCEEKYGECGGKLQEKEGPALAEEMLGKLGFEETVRKRVCYLVGHHHTYDRIYDRTAETDYQILVEADFLVNLYEDNTPKDAVRKAYEKIFHTAAGKTICKNMFDL